MSAVNNPLYDLAVGIMKDYKRTIAIMLETTKDKDYVELLRKEGIEVIQTDLLRKMSVFSSDERSLIVNIMAYEIYKGSSAVHDSIIWIGDKENLKGTASDTIVMLANAGLAYHVKKNGGVSRYQELKRAVTELKEVRVWSKEPLRADDYINVKEILVEGKTALLEDEILNVGDEILLQDGSYNVKAIAQSISRKNKVRTLKNSLTIYLY